MNVKIVKFDSIKYWAWFDLIFTLLTVVLATQVYKLNCEVVQAENEKLKEDLKNNFQVYDGNGGNRKIYGIDKISAGLSLVVFCFIICLILVTVLLNV